MFDMHIPDVEVFKEIPGYKLILKAVLKCQIQALVEQLSKQTGEESVLVTACPEDGTLTHLGSEVGKDFLGSHDEIKSKFLGFCFKRKQVQKKTQVSASEAFTIRKKGPQTQTKRPRLAPYNTARPQRVTNAIDSKTDAPKILQCENTPENLQFYQEKIKFEENQVENLNQNNSEDGSISRVKTEPSEDNDQMATCIPAATGDDGNQMMSHRASTLYPVVYSDGFQDGKAENIGDLSGVQCILNAENQSDIERDEGQGYLKTDCEMGTGQGHCGVKEEVDSEFPDHSIIVIENETLTPKNINLKERRNRNISKALSKALKKDQLKTDKELGKYLLLSEDEIRPFSCNLCPKKFKERHHLTYHLRIHSGLRPYKCEVCAKTFTQSSSLNTHKKLHLNEVRCMYCDVHFRKQSDFERHECKVQGDGLRSYNDGAIDDQPPNPGLYSSRQGTPLSNYPHDELNPFDGQTTKLTTKTPTKSSYDGDTTERPQCPVCGKDFKNSRNLRFHMLTHSGVRPYACMFCWKRFSQKNVLDQHVLTHTGQKPYSCPTCGKCFAQRATLYRHEKGHKAALDQANQRVDNRGERQSSENAEVKEEIAKSSESMLVNE